MMIKHTAISVLYSVRATLTNHYWVTSDERRRISLILFPFAIISDIFYPYLLIRN